MASTSSRPGRNSGAAKPVKIDLLKMPHHGSVRNSTEEFLNFFVADHYVFSVNGKFDNPDAPVVEAVVKMHGQRKIELYFTNARQNLNPTAPSGEQFYTDAVGPTSASSHDKICWRIARCGTMSRCGFPC